jgi:glycosyltransferase involved in cell wall biosynthesis
MKVALVHDWLTGMRGGERCLAQFLEIYPEADIFTLLHIPGKTTPAIDARVIKHSFLHALPNPARWYRHYLPLYPAAIRQFDFSGYDLVVSLSHAAAKNITLRDPKTVHISYCFSPMRYIWDQAQSYFGTLTPLFWPLFAALRCWDSAGAKRVHHFVAISSFIKARIRAYYHRNASVLFPPVDTSWIRASTDAPPSFKQGEAFLYAGALVPYKRVDLVIEAFNILKEPLWIVGNGPEYDQLRAKAGPHITFFGHISDAELAERLARCRALIFPGVEDFGMIPVECMAAGRPVIAYNKGGLTETVRGVHHWQSPTVWQAEISQGSATGVFINRSKCDTLSELIKAVTFFIAHESAFEPRACIERAAEFSPEQFKMRWHAIVRQALVRT